MSFRGHSSRILRIALVAALAGAFGASGICLAEEFNASATLEARANGHPLTPALRLAYDGLDHIERNVRDYSCMVVRRERVDGVLSTHHYIAAKVRHERSENGEVITPFSVYLNFRGPARLKGREVLYVEGQNGGQLLARRGGGRFGYLTASLDPTSELAMKDNRYPITDFGILNLVQKLIQVGEEDLHYGECEVSFFQDAKINNRSCTRIEVVHPIKRAHFRYHQASIFIDDELRLPVRYAAYDWPDSPGGEPKMLEEYTYVDLNINVGYTNADFDKRTYDFP